MGYKTIIVSIVLCGLETWLVVLREEQRVWVFENGVLRRMFGSKRVEVKGSWRKCIIRSFMVTKYILFKR
jgi:hypothetical protein